MNEGIIRAFLLGFSAKIKSTQRGKYYFQINTTALNCALKCSRQNVYSNCQFLTFKPPFINYCMSNALLSREMITLQSVTSDTLVTCQCESPRSQSVVNSCLSYNFCFAAQNVFFSFLFFLSSLAILVSTRKL